MSESFTFSDDRPAFTNVIVDETVEWQPDQVSNIDYSVDESNSTIADTINESYVTAVGDNTTQYLSVLDGTTDMTLENLDVNLNNSKDDGPAFDSEAVAENDQQMVLFTLEGSDEFYGIQLAQDEEGNVRKYQFQFRQTENGQYEAIPETIQIIQDEPEEQVGKNLEEIYIGGESNGEEVGNHSAEEEVEHILPHDINELNDNEITVMYNKNDSDSKVDLIQQIKEEKMNAARLAEQKNEEYLNNDKSDYQTKVENNYLPESHLTYNESSQELMKATVQQIVENIDTDDVEEDNPELIHIEHSENSNNVDESDDTDEYNIIDGLPITGDAEHLEPIKTNILKETLKMKDVKGKKDKLLYLIVQPSEKENVNSLSFDTDDKSVKRVNPRSVLKSSHSMIDYNNDTNDHLKNKRQFRGKEAMDARLFHTFINKTTIPQAPIRKDRLPRKQQIKKIERTDEEIIVKEVMITDNSFIDSDQTGESLDNDQEDLEVTAYVELTDSDEDYHPRKDKRKKKKLRKRVQVTISDEENDSDASIIDLDQSDEAEEEKNEDKTEDVNEDKSPMKRKRGRPSKQKLEEDDKLESPIKKIRLDSTDSNGDHKKVEISCPKCPKTFPSQNSLKTHLQHHNLENTILLRSRTLPVVEYKYKCGDCESSFKNAVLLKRHDCPKAKKYDCGICKKKFEDLSSLNVHKRTHAKTQLIKSTTVTAKVSPKKLLKQPSFKSPKSSNMKCKVCSKVCSSAVNLNVHLKTHFKCPTCSSAFISRIMLESHIRESCVKTKSPSNRRSLRIKSQATGNEATTTSIALKLNCGSCSMQFKTYNALFEHQVMKHGLSTPDKSVMEKKQKNFAKTGRGGGGGIRAKRVGGAFAALRSKQLEFGNKSE